MQPSIHIHKILKFQAISSPHKKSNFETPGKCMMKINEEKPVRVGISNSITEQQQHLTFNFFSTLLE